MPPMQLSDRLIIACGGVLLLLSRFAVGWVLDIGIGLLGLYMLAIAVAGE